MHVTHRPLQRSDTGSNRSVIGKAIPDLSLYILNESGGLAPAGVAGELHVGGAGLARGYWGRPELTAERFLPDPFGGEPGGRLYRTGDLARRLADGGLEYLGRCDRQVKIRGFRLELGEIEARLAGHPAVRNVFVQMVEDTPGDRSLAAYYTLRETSVELVDLRQHLRKELPDYMVPAHWFQLSEFPLTANGKLDRDALPKPTSARPECGASFTPPQTEAEGWLANIWMKVLKLDRAGVTDNFFDLGGHSLLMVQVQSLLRERHDLEVPIIQMFQFPTIRSLAGHLSAASRPPDPESTGLARAGLRGQMSERVRERGAHRNRQRAGAQRDAQESQV